jgi:aspartate carbamoyltransferase catalytic subunit
VMYKATQSQQINERTFGNAFAESSTSTTKVFRKANSGLFEKH